VGILTVAATSSCASDPGYIVVAVATDVQTPKDLDAVAVAVSTGGQTKYAYLGFPGRDSSGMALPATLVVEQPSDPSAEVRVRVVGFHAGEARVVRDAVTTVPRGRGALLRMPLAYLDLGSALGALPPKLAAPGAPSGSLATGDFDPFTIGSTCDFGQHLTSVGGRCASAVIDGADLPDYDPSAVLGATCFDVVGCFAGAPEVEGVDRATCTVSLGGGDAPSAYALATTDGAGACGGAGGRCLVPLQRDVPEGWTASGGSVQLAPGVCAALAGGARLFSSSACPAKQPWASTCASSAAVPEAGVEGGPEASTEAGPDGPSDADAGMDADADATLLDAPEAGPDVDAGPDCSGLLARMLASPLAPPAHYASLDFSNDGGSSGAFGSGGLDIDDLLACATSNEPADADAAALVAPGYRRATLGTEAFDGGGPPISLWYNAQSHTLYEMDLGPGYTGRLLFQSRAGGKYGAHVYEIEIENPATGATGEVMRDGKSWDLPWTDDAGLNTYKPWVNEIYDALMATFAPKAPVVDDCTVDQSSLYRPESVLPVETTTCLVLANDGSDGLLGVRSLPVYLGFEPGTNRVHLIYSFWLGSVTTCNTPQSNTERMLWELGGSRYVHQDGGTIRVGFSIGGIYEYPGVVQPAGLTKLEADAVECSGAAETAPDPGYGMIAWGPHGEVAMEYNKSTGVNYKLFARTGYRGNVFSIIDGTNDYELTPGAATKNGKPWVIDWTSMATATTEVTSVVNAWFYRYCGATPETDCVAAGDCSIVLDDGKGHSSFQIHESQATFDACGVAPEPIGFTFTQGTTDLTEVYVVNSGGQ
jgi:hypothetical protein